MSTTGRLLEAPPWPGERETEADGLHGPERNAVAFARGLHISVAGPGFAV